MRGKQIQQIVIDDVPTFTTYKVKRNFHHRSGVFIKKGTLLKKGLATGLICFIYKGIYPWTYESIEAVLDKRNKKLFKKLKK